MVDGIRRLHCVLVLLSRMQKAAANVQEMPLWKHIKAELLEALPVGVPSLRGKAT